MVRLFLFFAVILLCCFDNSSAQEKKWTLEDCINYAVENNLGLKRQILQTETAEANLLKSKMDYLPSLNAGSDARIGFGRSVDPVTNLITFKQNISNSYSINTNLQLFSGFTTLNSVSAYKFMLKAGVEAEKVNRNLLVADILGQYYQVLYARGLEDASKLQLDLSEKQLFRITKLVETGREALSKQYEMESRVSADKLDYTIAHNAASQALTTMKQMLQLEPGTYFDISVPDMSGFLISDQNYNPDTIYNIASAVLPRLKAIGYELRASEKQVAASIGAVSPSLSVGGAIYTGYYKVLNEASVAQESFSAQLKNNNSQALFMSLNIPIFNNYSTARNIRIAKIRRSDAALRLEQEKNNLYTEIENACLEYNRGRDEYTAALSNLEFNRKSFSAVEKKFETGLVDVTDYSAAKTTLFRAETEALRTKLQLIIRKLTIGYYTTGEYANTIFQQ